MYSGPEGTILISTGRCPVLIRMVYPSPERTVEITPKVEEFQYVTILRHLVCNILAFTSCANSSTQPCKRQIN